MSSRARFTRVLAERLLNLACNDSQISRQLSGSILPAACEASLVAGYIRPIFMQALRKIRSHPKTQTKNEPRSNRNKQNFISLWIDYPLNGPLNMHV